MYSNAFFPFFRLDFKVEFCFLNINDITSGKRLSSETKFIRSFNHHFLFYISTMMIQTTTINSLCVCVCVCHISMLSNDHQFYFISLRFLTTLNCNNNNVSNKLFDMHTHTHTNQINCLEINLFQKTIFKHTRHTFNKFFVPVKNENDQLFSHPFFMMMMMMMIENKSKKK